MLCIALIAFLTTTITVTLSKQIFIDYGVSHEGVELFKYFHDSPSSYYLDIGCYDPIYASNTLNLMTMGWTGINIDASYDRMSRFYMMRKQQNNLNYVVGDSDIMATLYDLREDSSSTVSNKVVNFVKKRKPVVKQSLVPSINMTQICDRLLIKKPLFLNLDIEGYGSKALLGNDWSKEKCRPQVIFSQINKETQVAGFELPSSVLTKNGYKKMANKTGLNEIFIDEKYVKKYEQKYKKGQKLLRGKRVVKIREVVKVLDIGLDISLYRSKHYQAHKDNGFFHFSTINEDINLLQINRYSNFVSSVGTNRPIIIFNFNPHYSNIIIHHFNYTASSVKMYTSKGLTIAQMELQSKYFIFTHIQVNISEQEQVNAYVLNHQITPIKQPNIILIQSQYQNTKPQSQSQPQPQPQISQNITELQQPTTQYEQQGQQGQQGQEELWRKKWQTMDTKIEQIKQKLDKLQLLSQRQIGLQEQEEEECQKVIKNQIKNAQNNKIVALTKLINRNRQSEGKQNKDYFNKLYIAVSKNSQTMTQIRSTSTQQSDVIKQIHKLMAILIIIIVCLIVIVIIGFCWVCNSTQPKHTQYHQELSPQSATNIRKLQELTQHKHKQQRLQQQQQM